MLRTAYGLLEAHYRQRVKTTTRRETAILLKELGYIYGGYFNSLKMRSKSRRSNYPIVKAAEKHILASIAHLDAVPSEFWIYYRNANRLKTKSAPDNAIKYLREAYLFCKSMTDYGNNRGRKEKDIEKHFIRKITFLYQGWLTRELSSGRIAPHPKNAAMGLIQGLSSRDLSAIAAVARILDRAISTRLVKSSLIQSRGESTKMVRVS